MEVVEKWLPLIVGGFAHVMFRIVPPADALDEHVVGNCLADLNTMRVEFTPNVTYMTAEAIGRRFHAWLRRSGLGNPRKWEVCVMIKG